MTPTDAVREAVGKVFEAVGRHDHRIAAQGLPDLTETSAALDALTAAVRAECGADTARVEAWVHRRIAELGPQPDITHSDSARYAWAGKATAYDNVLAFVTGASVDPLDAALSAEASRD